MRHASRSAVPVMNARVLVRNNKTMKGSIDSTGLEYQYYDKGRTGLEIQY